MKYSSNEFDVVDKIELDTGWFDHHVIYEIRVKDTGAHYYLTDKGELVPVYGFNGDIKTSESLDEKKDK